MNAQCGQEPAKAQCNSNIPFRLLCTNGQCKRNIDGACAQTPDCIPGLECRGNICKQPLPGLDALCNPTIPDQNCRTPFVCTAQPPNGAIKRCKALGVRDAECATQFTPPCAAGLRCLQQDDKKLCRQLPLREAEWCINGTETPCTAPTKCVWVPGFQHNVCRRPFAEDELCELQQFDPPCATGLVCTAQPPSSLKACKRRVDAGALCYSVGRGTSACPQDYTCVRDGERGFCKILLGDGGDCALPNTVCQEPLGCRTTTETKQVCRQETQRVCVQRRGLGCLKYEDRTVQVCSTQNIETKRCSKPPDQSGLNGPCDPAGGFPKCMEGKNLVCSKDEKKCKIASADLNQGCGPGTDALGCIDPLVCDSNFKKCKNKVVALGEICGAGTRDPKCDATKRLECAVVMGSTEKRCRSNTRGACKQQSDCLSALLCEGGSCRARSGGACEQDEDCTSGFGCSAAGADGTKRVCKEFITADQECGPLIGRCGAGLACLLDQDGKKRFCRQLPLALGARCNDEEGNAYACAGGLQCRVKKPEE